MIHKFCASVFPGSSFSLIMLKIFSRAEYIWNILLLHYCYYYYFTWIIYILDASDKIYTDLLFNLEMMSKVVENVITPVLVSSSSYEFV